MSQVKLTNYKEEDLIKVLGYEVYYVRQAQQNLIRHAQLVIDEAKAATEKLEMLAETLDKVCKKEDWHKDMSNVLPLPKKKK